MNFLVLSSSRGTTFQAVLDRIADGSLTARCLGLVSDEPDRGCVEKARAAHLPVAIVEREKGEEQETYDKRLHEAIIKLTEETKESKEAKETNDEKASHNKQTSKQANKQTILACMGWMFIFSPWFIAKWRNRMLNVHPALLPKYGGRGMFGTRVHEAVLKAHEKESGMTIHLMDEGVDTGKNLLQKTCPVLRGDTVETLKARAQALEKEWYPKVLQMIHTGELRLD